MKSSSQRLTDGVFYVIPHIPPPPPHTMAARVFKSTLVYCASYVERPRRPLRGVEPEGGGANPLFYYNIIIVVSPRLPPEPFLTNVSSNSLGRTLSFWVNVKNALPSRRRAILGRTLCRQAWRRQPTSSPHMIPAWVPQARIRWSGGCILLARCSPRLLCFAKRSLHTSQCSNQNTIFTRTTMIQDSITI